MPYNKYSYISIPLPHSKYEKCKQLALELKESETQLLEKYESTKQQLKSQELRYDKLKNHALTQLEG